MAVRHGTPDRSEVRQGTLIADDRGRTGSWEDEEDEQAHIKSNNPHLTGGEKDRDTTET